MKRLFYTLFCLALLACQKQEDTTKPADMIPEAKMVQILADVHVMESLIESSLSSSDTAVMVYNREHKNILKKYGVTNEQFHRSYNYYGTHLEEMDKLYERILDTLTAREAKLITKKLDKVGKGDSLKVDSVEAPVDTVVNKDTVNTKPGVRKKLRSPEARLRRLQNAKN